jgi:prepilin-type N-terminal cleavage/methylation domain-containing protein
MESSRSPSRPHRRRGFSLVEVLAAITIIGVITFLAIPNIVRVKQDSEDSLARARADALNLAAATYFQAVGPDAAASAWSSADNNARYLLLAPYLSFAPPTLADYLPGGYAVDFHASAPHRVKATLIGPRDPNMPY